MLLDLLANSAAYAQLGPRFLRGFNWLSRFDPAQPDGRVEIDENSVFALVQSYDTANATSKRYESHRTYADIQFIVEGREVIQYSPIAGLEPVTEFEAARDVLLYADPASGTDLRMDPGMFAVFLPQDGHKPGCSRGVAQRVRKVVIKVRL